MESSFESVTGRGFDASPLLLFYFPGIHFGLFRFPRIHFGLSKFTVTDFVGPAAHVAGLPQELQKSEQEPTAGQMSRPGLFSLVQSHASLKELPYL